MLQPQLDHAVRSLLKQLGAEVIVVQSWDALLAVWRPPWPDLVCIDPDLMEPTAKLPADSPAPIQLLPAKLLSRADDLQPAEWLADTLTQAVSQARERRQRRLIYERLRQREIEQSRAAMLLRICANYPPQQVLSHLMMSIRQYTHAETGMLHRRDRTGATLTCEVLFGKQDELLGQHLSPINQRIAEWIAETGNSLWISDLSADSRFSTWLDPAAGPRALVGLPLTACGVFQGVLQLSNSNPGALSSRDLRLLTDIGTLIALVVALMPDVSAGT
jgi:transcriptional regulator with GAF, ATPase, and Fis domain